MGLFGFDNVSVVSHKDHKGHTKLQVERRKRSKSRSRSRSRSPRRHRGSSSFFGLGDGSHYSKHHKSTASFFGIPTGSRSGFFGLGMLYFREFLGSFWYLPRLGVEILVVRQSSLYTMAQPTYERLLAQGKKNRKTSPKHFQLWLTNNPFINQQVVHPPTTSAPPATASSTRPTRSSNTSSRAWSATLSTTPSRSSCWFSSPSSPAAP